MPFSGQDGTNRSEPGNMVPGFGAAVVHNATSFSASMTPTATNQPTFAHTYVFTIVSITLYRAVSRAKNFLSVFRTQ